MENTVFTNSVIRYFDGSLKDEVCEQLAEATYFALDNLYPWMDVDFIDPEVWYQIIEEFLDNGNVKHRETDSWKASGLD